MYEHFENKSINVNTYTESIRRNVFKVLKQSSHTSEDIFKDIIIQTEKICIEAVKQNGYALDYVKDQTETICIEAVKQNGDALQYVKNQTETICIEAVKQNGLCTSICQRSN